MPANPIPPPSAPYKPALDRIDAFLAPTNPGLERQKIEQAMILLFGKEMDLGDLEPGVVSPVQTKFPS
jgi:hypothetical protein